MQYQAQKLNAAGECESIKKSMTAKQRKLAYELITNPPPGSKLAAARDWGVDLTLLYENLLLTPTERARSFASTVRSFEVFRAKAKKTARF
jgi:hypothetical protein